MTDRPPTEARSRVTAHDVARVAGVSTGTVSRVVNEHPAVADDVRRKVAAAIEQLGWRPNAVARSMRTATTRTIGCIFSNIRNPLYAAIIQGAEEALALEGYTLMVASSGESPEREAKLIQLFANRRTDGLILSLADESDEAVIRAVRTAGIPVVLIERDLPLDVDSVGTDHRSSIRGAVEYLFTLGHRRIALITGGQTNRAGRERLGGFVDAFREANITIDPAMLRLESLSSDYGFRETQALLKLQDPPTAVIAGGNLMLAGVLRAAHLLNVCVPQDLSIISSGDTDLAELATPPVTAIRWDLAAVGREAASLMLGRLGGTKRSEPTRIEVSFEIVLRKSCAPVSA